MFKGGAFRKKKVYFAQVSNHALRDNTLSLKAKGLYALIQSYLTIEGFTLYKSTLKKQCLEGEQAFENTWKELKQKGYLIQYKYQSEKGSFYYEYELLDEVLKESQLPPVSHTLENEGVDRSPCGKVGIYSNTDINNTDINNNKSVSQSPEEGQTDGRTKFPKAIIRKDIKKTMDATKRFRQAQDQQQEIKDIITQSQIELFEDADLQENIKDTIKQAYQDTNTRDTIKKLKLSHIDIAIAKFRQAQEQQEIRSPKLYFLRCLISAIEEFGLKKLF